MTIPEDISLAYLLSNNAKWANGIKEEDAEFFRKRSTDSEEPETEIIKPKVLYIGCSDWRVPESAVSALHPGGIFVHRNIANQFHLNDDNALSVLAYAVENLKVSHIIVAGHTLCGGAQAALDAAHASCPPPPPPSSPLARWLVPLTKIAGAYDDLTELIEANVRAQVNNVAGTGVVQAAWANNRRLQVHGFIYELETGLFRNLGISVDGPSKGDVL